MRFRASGHGLLLLDFVHIAESLAFNSSLRQSWRVIVALSLLLTFIRHWGSKAWGWAQWGSSIGLLIWVNGSTAVKTPRQVLSILVLLFLSLTYLKIGGHSGLYIDKMSNKSHVFGRYCILVSLSLALIERLLALGSRCSSIIIRRLRWAARSIWNYWPF